MSKTPLGGEEEGDDDGTQTPPPPALLSALAAADRFFSSRQPVSFVQQREPSVAKRSGDERDICCGDRLSPSHSLSCLRSAVLLTMEGEVAKGTSGGGVSRSTALSASASAPSSRGWKQYFADPADALEAMAPDGNDTDDIEGDVTESSDWNEAIRLASSQMSQSRDGDSEQTSSAPPERPVAAQQGAQPQSATKATSASLEKTAFQAVVAPPPKRGVGRPLSSLPLHRGGSAADGTSSVDSRPNLRPTEPPSPTQQETTNDCHNSEQPSKDVGDEGEDDHLPPYYQYSDRISWPRVAMDDVRRVRLYAGNIVNHQRVQLFIVALIAVNAIMMGVATFPFVKDDPVVAGAFDLTDTIILIIFTIELGLQFLYVGWRLVLDGWLVFDLVIIVMSWSFDSVQIIRAFRIFRALRLVTRIKVMKNLILALFSVMPRMFAIGLLLFLVSYIFAVLCTQLFTDLYPTYTEINYWGRLDATFFSLFQIMTLDNWADITRTTMLAYPYAWLPIIIFVIVTGFVVVNLIIAVICDAISALHEDDKAKLHGNFTEGRRKSTGGGGVDDGDECDVVGAEDGSSSSVHPALREDIRVQLSTLETHVEELTRTQEETLRTLQALTVRLAEHRTLKRKLPHQRRGRTQPRGPSDGTARMTTTQPDPESESL